MGTYLTVILLLVIIAASMRDDFAMTLIYLLLGAYALATWWSSRSLSKVEFERKFTDRAFLGERVEIAIEIRNQGWLPLLWLGIQDGLHVALSTQPSFDHVTSLGPKSKTVLHYSVDAKKRGYYPIGPLFLSTGDILGLGGPQMVEKPAQYLTVYPRIVPLTEIGIPSRSPQGTLRHVQPIFEDPTRVLGKRDYRSSDSLRRVDWKSSARSGRLQVKVYEPSIALETLILLNLNADDYHYRSRIDSTELAIVLGASIASWISGKGQAVGLLVNGKDPLTPGGRPSVIPPRKGQAHLMRLLEILARVEMTQDASFPPLVERQRYQVPWGTTLLVITGQAQNSLLDQLYQARRSGQDASLILAGPAASFEDTSNRAARFGIPVTSILNEHEMDVWRQG